jgi:glutathione S-transferase
VTGDLPVLYSFRRCPYAIRARMALRYSGVRVELREVVLRDLPRELLFCSPKATVPVLVLPDGAVLDESRDIMEWALAQHDPDRWRPQTGSPGAAAARCLIDANDLDFKPQLDRYKYAVRYPEHPVDWYRSQSECFLDDLEQRLKRHAWLLGERMSIADVAILPFVRQFALVDREWFDASPRVKLRNWLDGFLQAELFSAVMFKYPRWRSGDPVSLFP